MHWLDFFFLNLMQANWKHAELQIMVHMKTYSFLNFEAIQ